MADEKIQRRDFINIAGKATLLTAFFGGGAYLLSQNEYSPPVGMALDYDADHSVAPDNVFPDLAAVRSKDHVLATVTAISLVGGIERFISRGDIVTIKANVGWDRTAEQGANTSPLLLEAVIRQCLKAGARRVVVADVPCNEARLTFARSGVKEAAEKTGASIVMPEQHLFVRADLGGEILGEWPVLRPFLETDKLINMPVVKHHGLCRATISMKNWYGVLGGPRNRLHQRIDTSIADLSDYFRPTLTVVDATRVMVRNGPVGGSLSDVEIKDTVIAATDQLAADSYSCRFLGLNPDHLIYLKVGNKRGLGKMVDYTLVEKDLG
jgi:uncharacterized protein (DUF362 family)